jgi:RNA polymerase sigma-70 factor (ECF subfamily)
VHCEAQRAQDTDWPQILRLYDLLQQVQPTPIVALNRAVAVAMVNGPQAAVALVDALGSDLDSYHLFHAARADLLRRLGAKPEAAKSYARALELATNASERRFLQRRLTEMRTP